jgi:hypothetical protein
VPKSISRRDFAAGSALGLTAALLPGYVIGQSFAGPDRLAVAPDEYLKQRVAELKSFNPDVVIPMHCSGTKFIAEMQRQMPDRLALSTTGSEFTLGA